MYTLKIKTALFLLLVIGTTSILAKKQLPPEILSQLNKYNVTWNTLSTTGSMESMPLGNGDITANVWIEKGGDLLMYIGKSDTWSEGTRLLKVGRIRIRLSPNPFMEDAYYSQVLNLYGGEINVSAGERGNKTTLKIWIDANQPVVRVETSSDKPVSVACTTEILRPAPYTLSESRDPLASSFRGLINSPVKPFESADILVSKPDRVQWYHRNETSFFETILTKQGVPELLKTYSDPYIHRTFGAAIMGKDLNVKNDSTLVSEKPGRKFTISIYPYTAQTNSVSEWDRQLESLFKKADAQKIDISRDNHYAWWDQFWNRSWIFLSGDKDAEKVTQGYLLQRFMMACQSRGEYPAKFNGGNFTFDYKGLNGDYRYWGPGYWQQNNRLFHWPLIASGDWDLIKPWFDMFMNALSIQTDITKKYYNHGGAFFPETLNFFGLFIQDDWGWNNETGKASDTRWIRYHYSGALEMLTMMLEYYNYSKDEAFVTGYIIPFATQVIRFFNSHWPRINEIIRFVPANTTEQFWDCVNPVDYIAGLQYTIQQLNKLPVFLVHQDLKDEWNNCLKSLPPIPMSRDKTKILPAEEFGQPRNVENPECYVIFPFKLYGLELDNLDIALNTFNARTFIKSRCWSQDPIQAPLLGLTDFAKECITKNANDIDPEVRFPAFWKSQNDYTPDIDNGGAMSIGLQNMLLQNVGNKILVLPAFPASWNVDFKLCAFDNTTVRIKSKGKTISQIDVFPKTRMPDVVYY